ncbi:nucleoside diphosphate kinase-like isoform X1 [Sinocyclocheilus anshuiensis]|uniref:nucleoside-diphosphate kinase n=1 Tax=Sinocyclocheilus anshuiensis TaxID=1608454 RepID=A0A671N1V3_9TELE|nr:PREDICTED: nucleoside diphosphate kinase-like isoform X1 [Sinocyclocheilus anshuiensis]
MAAKTERTFIAIKPDGVQRGLIGDIVKRFEQKGFRLVAMKFLQASEDLLKQHYIDLKDRPFYPGLVKYMSSGPVAAMVWEGLNVVKTGRVMLGETNPADSKPGTIRGDFCIEVGRLALYRSVHDQSDSRHHCGLSNPTSLYSPGWSNANKSDLSYRPKCHINQSGKKEEHHPWQ